MIQKDAFTEAIMSLLPSLRRIALSILRSEADAQDAVSQAVLKAWEKHASIDAARFKPYVTQILVNECRNIQRARQRVFPIETLPENTYVPTDTGLLETLNALDEALRTPLLLHYMEGYKEREIAKALNLTLPQVKSRLFKGRKLLKAMLKAEVNEQ